jgi:excisionase family DNA binding protein
MHIEKDLTVKDVAEELSLHPDTVKRLLHSGVMTGYKADLKQWRITRKALDQFKSQGGAKRPGRPRKDDDQ